MATVVKGNTNFLEVLIYVFAFFIYFVFHVMPSTLVSSKLVHTVGECSVL